MVAKKSNISRLKLPSTFKTQHPDFAISRGIESAAAVIFALFGMFCIYTFVSSLFGSPPMTIDIFCTLPVAVGCFWVAFMATRIENRWRLEASFVAETVQARDGVICLRRHYANRSIYFVLGIVDLTGVAKPLGTDSEIAELTVIKAVPNKVNELMRDHSGKERAESAPLSARIRADNFSLPDIAVVEVGDMRLWCARR